MYYILYLLTTRNSYKNLVTVLQCLLRKHNFCYSHIDFVHCFKSVWRRTKWHCSWISKRPTYSCNDSHLDSPSKLIHVRFITGGLATNRSWTLFSKPTPLNCWGEPSSPLQLAGRAYQRPRSGSAWSWLSLPRPDAIDWCLGSTRSPMSTDPCRHQPGTSLTIIVAQVIALTRSLYGTLSFAWLSLTAATPAIRKRCERW